VPTLFCCKEDDHANFPQSSGQIGGNRNTAAIDEFG
jgi:hypothetical protein